MNFLAHFHLSGSHEKIAIGNFNGDFIRGTRIEDMEEEVQLGLKLHRFIDEFTDGHEVVKQVNKILQPYFRKYAPVVSDVYFDYFLAHHFEDYSDISLREYTHHIYGVMKRNLHLMTPRAVRFYHFMMERDIFYAYGNKEGMQHVFNGLSHKATFESNLANGVTVLTQLEDQLYVLFKEFYPQLQQAAHAYLTNELGIYDE